MKYILIAVLFFSCTRHIDQVLPVKKAHELESCFKIDKLPSSAYEFRLTGHLTEFSSKNIYKMIPKLAVIYLVFGSDTVVNTMWNQEFGDTILSSGSGLTSYEQQSILDSVSKDFAGMNVIVTTNKSVYDMATPTMKSRIIITQDWQWHGGGYAGTSYYGTFTWGTNTPAFVFSSLLNYNTKKISEATSHETGHTFGLKHQSVWENGVKTFEYNGGNDYEAPIMGVSYYATGVWWIGLNNVGDLQDDSTLIKQLLPLNVPIRDTLIVSVPY